MGQLTILATKDAAVYNANPGTNYNDVLRIGNNAGYYWRSLLMFPLTALAGKTINSVYLQMVQANYGTTNTLPFSAHCLSADWSETGVDWDNQPAYTTTAAISLSISTNTQAWRSFNITNLIKDIVNNGRTYYGILLRQPGSESNNEKMFFSRNTGTDYTPQLLVDYKGGFSAKVGSSWKTNTTTYIKVGTQWKEATVFIKVGTQWKESL
jgi:hypothetical protein